MSGNTDPVPKANYKLSPVRVIDEAIKVTAENFFSFSPAILITLFIQLAVFYIALELQIPDLATSLSVLKNPLALPDNLARAFIIANLSCEVIIAPIYAGTCLMALRQSSGLKTSPYFFFEGLNFTVTTIFITLVNAAIKSTLGQLSPLLSAYYSVTSSHSVLLACDKKMSVATAIMVSFKATNLRIFPIISLYALCLVLFILALAFFGLGLFLVLPFFLHVKGILYRDMFSIMKGKDIAR